jgi:signal transduction histidine kinase
MPTTVSPQKPGRQTLSGWQLNLLAFGCLILVVMGYYYWQTRQIRAAFALRVQAQSAMLAGVIRLNAENAVASRQGIEEILQTFLGNTSRFVAYLDQIEPFSNTELGEFAAEAGLRGIFIQRSDGSQTADPGQWLTTDSLSRLGSRNKALHWLEKQHLYVMKLATGEDNAFVAVGFAAEHIENLQKKLSFDQFIGNLARLPGIRYVKLIDAAPEAEQERSPGLSLKAAAVETLVEIDGRYLLIGLDNTTFLQRNRQLWFEFFGFSLMLLCLGVGFSWLLYQYQQRSFLQMQTFEQQLSQQREDASLGQATAAIAHEIRNPLNAISMGLQRLQLESRNLNPDEKGLIVTMREAVQRTNKIVTGLQRYAQPLVAGAETVNLKLLVQRVVTLYQPQLTQQQIELDCRLADNCLTRGDETLLEQVVENLFKNSLEAQPAGGWISIATGSDSTHVWLCISNGGFNLTEEQRPKIAQPYFTTKTQGTGLGLATVQRIVLAHQGTLAFSYPRPQSLSIRVRIPKDTSGGAVETNR